MVLSDDAFLAEVEDFLTACDLPAFPSPSCTKEGGAKAQRSTGVKAPPRRRESKSAEVNAAVKRELEKAKDRKRRSAYRERRRQEKKNLQQQVGELSTKLEELKGGHEDTLTSPSWRFMAERQLQARLSAENQQRQLVAAIDRRAEMIRDFHEFLRSKASSVALELEVDGELYTRKKVRVEPSDAEFYSRYVKGLDEHYAKVDEYLRLCGVDSLDVDEEHEHQWKEDGSTGNFLYGDKSVMPFDFHKTCQHAWDTAQITHRQESREDYKDVVDPENTAAFKFRVTTRLKSGRVASVLHRAVARRYQEEHRQVIIWRTFSEGEGMFTGMHADESGCCVVTPIESDSTPGTLMRTAMCHVPMHFSRSVAEQPAAKEFTGMLLDSGTEDGMLISSKLESLLLEDS